MPPRKPRPKVPARVRRLRNLEKKLEEKIQHLQKARGDTKCYPFLMGSSSIGPPLVDDIYAELRANFKHCDGKLDVLLDSSGGDIDAAYNLAQLLRRFGSTELNFIVPRWAKSAATLLVCSGDRILMTPVAELGPVDPQITAMNPLEGRIERFSPLHIDSTLALIRDEFTNGNRNLAQALMERLQFPLTLGSYRKSLDIAKQYLERLLATRMFRNETDSEKRAKSVAAQLTEGYADHGFCIDSQEARRIGLVIDELEDEDLNIVWEIHQLNSKRTQIFQEKSDEEVEEKLKQIPPGILDKLLPEVQQKLIPEGGDNGLEQQQ